MPAARAVYAVMQVPVFACIICAGGMLITFPQESASLFADYRGCAPAGAVQLQRFCLYASEQPKSLGALLVVLALLTFWSFAEVSRVIGFLAFIYRFMLVLNGTSAVAAAGVLAVGGLLMSESRRATGGEDAQAQVAKLVPEWAPPLLLFAGGVMLVMSLLAYIGLSRRLERVLYLHVFLSTAIWLTLTVGAARCAALPPARDASPSSSTARASPRSDPPALRARASHGRLRAAQPPRLRPNPVARPLTSRPLVRARRQRMHVSELGYIAAAHKLSVACTVVLVLLLLVLNVAGSLHMILEIRRQGISFSELVDSADYTMGYKLRNNLGAPLPVLKPIQKIVGSTTQTRNEPIPFSLELDEQDERRFHTTVNAKAFFAPR